MALSDLFTDIADAIRDKDGTTEKIVARDFPERISAIPSSNNQNLLDNWYFADPINQQVDTTYTGGRYSIDRWYLGHGSTDKITLTNDGIELETSTGEFIQKFEKPILGKTLTFSLLLSTGDLWTVSGTTPETRPTGYFEVCTQGRLHIGFYDSLMRVIILGGTKVTLVAAKLELGPQQTLARQDSNGNWVLNDPPPNKALELVKCQRYQFVSENWFRISTTGVFSNALDFFVPLPVTPRANPSHVSITGLISSGKIIVQNNPNSLSAQSSFTCGDAQTTASGLSIRLAKNPHNLTSDALIQINKGAIFDFNL